MTDPIGDMITRIKNAQKANHLNVQIPFSKLKLAIAKILKKEGYVDDVIQHKKGFKISLEIVFKKTGDVYAISGIKRISKPGQRIYVGNKKMPKVLGGYGFAIISTSRGIMTNLEAKEKNLGGEVICEVW